MPKHKAVGGKKSVKIKKVAPKKAKPIYVSDDDIPDESAESFYKDDIDLHHDQLDKDSDDEYTPGALPEAKAPRREAVYDFSDSEDEDEMESRLKKIEANIRRRQKLESSDSEEEEVEDEVAKARAWGKKRDDFYGADITTKVDVGVSSDDEEAEAILEEKEARMMQEKMAAEVTEEEFGLDMFADSEAISSAGTAADLTMLESGRKVLEGPEVVQVDFSKMSEKEKARTFKQLYPEYMPIYAEFKRMLRELKERLWPLLSLRIHDVIPATNAISSLKDKAKLMELFVQCALFYFLLVAERETTKGHPVFERMLSLQKLIKKYDEMEIGLFKDQMDRALQMIVDGKEDEIMSETTSSSKAVKRDPVQSQSKVQNTTTGAKAKKKTKQATEVIEKKSHVASPKSGPKNAVKAIKPKKTKNAASESQLEVPASKGKKAKKETTNTIKKRMQDLLNEDDEQPVDQGADMTSGEKEALEYYNMMRKRHRVGEEEANSEDGEEVEDINGVTSSAPVSDLPDDKRAITEEMQKNRGLTAKRPKHLKNPRIKNKLKFQKKKKIHKTMVPQVLREMSRYGGEVGGIRAGRVRSVALS